MQNFVGKHGKSDNRLVKSWFFPVHFFKNLNIKHLIHPIVIEILPLWHLPFYGSLVRFKKLRVTCLTWLQRWRHVPHLPVAAPLVFCRDGHTCSTSLQSIAVCVPSFDKFCLHTNTGECWRSWSFNNSSKLRECTKKFERYHVVTIVQTWISNVV